ncbi:uncharacterized protein M421DRAFT_329896 [Didymella exigua CBS 183.55]|uniref:Malate dehydrogenase n=1 Tax=Didymella exigua CBS 183.55 TaxID=1150837 RepID=A0A6A5R7U6_9PLEO|nr:uncharacterized protein M421DRAFT_329896 [Didymella exigua CBS 183.55]KAF1923238.1 hypothetical protein M421DRAFT_329896 [Didymella exigua CBS 183.55]
MIFINTFSIALALAPATLFAAPTRTIDSIALIIPRDAILPRMIDQMDQASATCDLSNAALPATSGLPAIGAGLKLKHIAVGRGIQNYTCATAAATETPKAIGAVASLFNATCDGVHAPAVLASVTKIAIGYSIPDTKLAEGRLSGHHEFTEKGVPFFKLQTDKVNFGTVHVGDPKKMDAPKDASEGPNGLGSVPWLKLTHVDGDYQEVYRINTAGGVAPKTCEGVQGNISVDYAAEYWFFA